MRAATRNCSDEQRPRLGHVTAVTGCNTGVQQRLRFSDPFGDRRPRPVDVRAGPRVAAIQKQHPCPDVDGSLQPSPNVVIEIRQEQLFNFDRVIGAPDTSGWGLVTLRGIGHRREVQLAKPAREPAPRFASRSFSYSPATRGRDISAA